MLAIKIWKYLKGYVIIRIEGLTLERLLNLALSNGIYLWDVKRISNLEIQVTVSTIGFKSLRELVRKVGCRVDIKDKRGLPFILSRLKKRKMLGFGILVFLTFIVFLSSFVWEIEIKGTEQTPDENIIAFLNEKDVKVGKLKKSIDIDKTIDYLFKEYDYFSFLDVRIKGVKLILEIKEEELPPEKVDKSYPCNIVAKKKAVILKIIAKNGRALVKAGQIVNENTVLISGVIDNINNSYLVHAEGEVLAQTRYSAIKELPIVKLDKKETGKVYRQKGIKINDRGIKLLKGEIPYKDYIEEVKEKRLIDLKWPDIKIPIWLITYEYREVEIVEVKQNIDFLKNATQLLAIEEINLDLPDNAEIIEKNVIHTIDDNILRTQVVIETIEDIGKKQILK